MEEQVTALQKFINTVIEFLVGYSFQVLGAIIVLAVGFLIANWVHSLLIKFCQKQDLDITLSKFMAGFVRIMILAFALLIALGKFGITITPFIAALGAIAFGATYAIQGPLSNYGAGLSIIMGRPFVIGDTITVKEVSGTVEEVKLACTVLKTEDNVKITVPNKYIVGEVLYNSKKSRAVDGLVGISYDNDPAEAIAIIKKVLSTFPDIVTDPSAQIGIQTFADSSVNIAYRYWIPTIKYVQSVFAVNLAVYKALKDGGIAIPYPQRDLHIVSVASGVPANFPQTKG